ncbi:MAG: hypothetical protein DCF12_05775 [Snowella sp.]|jgi:hypothetical protein|nr:MAG: hypothetical protein DCF12_05775 [Snowella sp.]
MSIQKRFFVVSVSLVCVGNIVASSYAQPSLSQTKPAPVPAPVELTTTSSQSRDQLSVIFATIVAASSVLLLPLSRAFSKRIEEGVSDLETEKINKIAGLVKAESEREKASIFRAMTERSFPQAKLKGIELEASDVNKPIKSAIEGLVKSYHSQALRQSGIQFYFSVAAATVGFGLIIYAGMSAVNTDNPKKLLNTFPGAVISGVSALFFKQAEDTRKRATDLYDRLRSDERQSQAITLANGIESQEFRSLVQAQLVLHLADVKDTKPIDLGSQVSKLIVLKDPSPDETT